jgi:transposase
MVYIGVDLHRKKSQVAALDQDGKLVFNRKVRTGPAEMQQLIDELRPQPIEVAFEATFGWGWFADLLAELGVPAHMAHPLKTKAVSSARVKNDAVDAKMLAHLLRADLLPEGWIAAAGARGSAPGPDAFSSGPCPRQASGPDSCRAGRARHPA